MSELNVSKDPNGNQKKKIEMILDNKVNNGRQNK
jgi:hypothetical protein